MDTLTRWSIAIGFGAVAAAAAFSGYVLVTDNARTERAEFADNSILNEYRTLDATVQYVSFDKEKVLLYADDLLLENGKHRDGLIEVSCHDLPVEPCAVTSTFEDALTLKSIDAPSPSAHETVAVGRYISDIPNLLKGAHTVTTEVASETYPVSVENNTFTVNVSEQHDMKPTVAAGEMMLSNLPLGVLLIGLVAAWSLVTALLLWVIPRREDEVEIVEYDEMFEALT